MYIHLQHAHFTRHILGEEEAGQPQPRIVDQQIDGEAHRIDLLHQSLHALSARQMIADGLNRVAEARGQGEVYAAPSPLDAAVTSAADP